MAEQQHNSNANAIELGVIDHVFFAKWPTEQLKLTCSINSVASFQGERVMFPTSAVRVSLHEFDTVVNSCKITGLGVGEK